MLLIPTNQQGANMKDQAISIIKDCEIEDCEKLQMLIDLGYDLEDIFDLIMASF